MPILISLVAISFRAQALGSIDDCPFAWRYLVMFVSCRELLTGYIFSHCPFLTTALNEALKKEVERLKVATGEIMTHTDTFNLGMHHIPYIQSSFVPLQPQHMHVDTQNMQMPPFRPFQSNMLSPNQSVAAASNSHAFADMMQHDPLGRLQGLDISSRGSHMVKSAGPSISAGESSGTS